MTLQEKIKKLDEVYDIWVDDHDCAYGRKGEFLCVHQLSDEAWTVEAKTQEEVADILLARLEFGYPANDIAE